MTSSRRAVLVLTAVNLLWGSTFFLTKRSLEALGTGWAPWLALRFLAGAAATLLVFRPRLEALRSGALWRDAFWIALPTSAGFALQSAGIPGVSPATSAFLTSLYVPFTPLAAWLLFRTRPSRSLAVGLVVAGAGLWLITAPDGVGRLGRGELLSAACGAAFAVQIVLVGRLAPRHDAGALTSAMALIQALGFLLLALCGDGLPVSRALGDPWAWGPLLYMGVVVNVFAFWAMNRFQHRLDASHAAVVYALEPLFAAAFSALWAGERFGPIALLGAVLVVGANLWTGRTQAAVEPLP